jgi:hypothetical protein
LIFIVLLIGGIAGFIYSIEYLSTIVKISRDNQEMIPGRIEKIVQKYRRGENNVHIKYGHNKTERISIAKITTFFLEEGDEIHIIEDEKSDVIVIYELLSKIKITYYIRILLFLLCVALSFPVWKAVSAIAKETIKA